jgi:hypothetical protein
MVPRHAARREICVRFCVVGATAFRFPPEVTVLAVRRDLRFGLSNREKSCWPSAVSTSTTTGVSTRRMWSRPLGLSVPGGRPARAVIDAYASTRWDSAAARQFFQRARIGTGVLPSEVVTDRCASAGSCAG